MTQLFIVGGVWSNPFVPGNEDDWDVWLTDKEEESRSIIDALGASGAAARVRRLVPSRYFEAQYALNPRRGDDWEGYVGPRVDDPGMRSIMSLSTLAPLPRRAEQDAPVWVRQDK